PTLERRIAAYVRDDVPDEMLLSGVLPTVGVMPVRGRGLWDQARGAFERMLGGGDALRLRLSQAGAEQTPAAFRGRQLAWAVAGLVFGAVLVIALALAGRLTPPAVVLPVLTRAGAAAGFDMQLTARARSRRARLADELPTTLEFLALCLSAGDSP